MSDHHDALRDLLDSERARPALSMEHRARLLARVTDAIGGGGGGGPGGSGALGSVARATAPPARPSLLVRLASRAAWSSAGRALGLVATFALGGVTGAVVHARLAHPSGSPPGVHGQPAPVAPPAARPAAPPVATSPASAATAVPSRAAPEQAADLTIPPSEVIDAAPAAPPRAHADGTTLAAERARLAVAYDALARGDGPGALDALARYQREFPRGRLAEERDGLWIQALVAAGRYDEARARAARFRREHATSIFAAAVDAVVRSIP